MILVVGGAGYIGSHMVRLLVEQGRGVIVLDDLSTGHAEAIDPRATFVQGDLGDAATLDRLFQTDQVDAVMHFAAKTLVPESVRDPGIYYDNNVAKTIRLLESMRRASVRTFVFSSTAATYGEPQVEVVSEDEPTAPINPYGQSKLMVEQILRDYARAYGFRYTVFRYFNAAGAEADGTIGEDHTPETHLVPIVLQHLIGQREQVMVYGDDYPTPDGTCIRDYVHVKDLTSAHLLALDAMLQGTIDSRTYNLASETGYSVLEVIRTAEEVTGRKVTWSLAPRRIGDPPRLVATSRRILRDLGWAPTRDLREIIQTAWKWHASHPDGYRS